MLMGVTCFKLDGPEISEMSDSDCKGSPPPVTGRHEKSLGLLTSKFVELLQSSKGGILDLKKVHV